MQSLKCVEKGDRVNQQSFPLLKSPASNFEYKFFLSWPCLFQALLNLERFCGSFFSTEWNM